MIADVERLKAVAHLLLGAAGRQHAGEILPRSVCPIPRPDERRSHLERDVVCASPARTLDGDSNVGEREVVISGPDLFNTA